MSVPCSSEEFVPWRGGTGVNETGRFAFCYVTQEQTGEADTPTKLITSLNLQLGWKPYVAYFGVIPAVPDLKLSFEWICQADGELEI